MDKNGLGHYSLLLLLHFSNLQTIQIISNSLLLQAHQATVIQGMCYGTLPTLSCHLTFLYNPYMPSSSNLCNFFYLLVLKFMKTLISTDNKHMREESDF